MKSGKKLVSGVLLLAMLLSSFGGGVAHAAGGAAQTVATGQELAFAPLEEGGSVVYERHEAGYQVTLDRAADYAVMHITSVPGSERDRTPEKTRLYVRTGVTLKAGVTYRVGYTLGADVNQSYTLCFDGAAENAYGQPEEKTVKAGAAQQVRTLLTPEAESGELVLRLLVGKTGAAGNALRLSDLTVEEASEAQVEAGAGKMLVDSLDYHAPGSITVWANDDSGAKLTTGENSATLTVTQAPTGKVEVWKIKLLVHTGLNPEAGKTYRLKADVLSSVAADYEICYNEGDTEKGYDVLYNQKLTGKKQTLERSIYVPRDKESAGEIVLQLSLGKLPQGETVTISNIRVEEAVPRYKDVLPSNFAYDTTDVIRQIETEKQPGSYSRLPLGLAYDGYGNVWDSNQDEYATQLAVTDQNATLTITNAPGDRLVYKAKLFIRTGVVPDGTSTYRISYKIQGNKAQDYEILFKGERGTDEAYGAEKEEKLRAGVTHTFSRVITPAEEKGELVLIFQLGKTPDASGNTITVSDVKVQKVESTAYQSVLPATFSYGGVTKEGTGTLTLSDTEAKLSYTAASHDYDHKLIIDTGVVPQANVSYQVKFNARLESGAQNDIAALYGVNGVYEAQTKYGDKYGISLSTDNTTVGHTFTATEGGNEALKIFFQVGKTTEDHTVIISDLTVTANSAPAVSPFRYNSSFSHGGSGNLTRNNTQVSLHVYGGTTDELNQEWRTKLYIDTGVDMTAGHAYRVGFHAQSDMDTNYQVRFNDISSGVVSREEGKFGRSDPWPALQNDGRNESYVIYPTENGLLEIQLDLGKVNDKTVIISNVTVEEITYSGPDLTGGTKPNAALAADLATVNGYTASIADDDRSVNQVKVKITAVPASADERKPWLQKLFVTTGFTPEANKGYRVSFDILSTATKTNLEAFYESNGDEQGYGGEWNQSLTPNVKKTVQHIINPGASKGRLKLQIRLGETTGGEFTVSNVKVEEITYVDVQKTVGSWVVGTSTFDVQDGYRATLDRAKDHATLNILETPATGMEAWKSKLFIDTGVQANADETFRVTMDVTAEKDMDFEVCYNRGDIEKGFDAVYNLHAAAGAAKTVEKVFTAERGGRIKVQLSLGNVPASNAVTVSNLRVEKATLTYSGKSALPQPLRFSAASAVSSWAHGDYSTSLTGSDEAITMNILKAPAAGAEPWKIKLFLDTGAVLEAGKYYKVTTDLLAQKAQTVEICYNSGGAEAAYDAQRGIALAAGEKKRVEKLLSVPATMTDASNLMLQVNLGGTDQPNAVTVSGITVEEVPVSYVDRAGRGMAYLPGQTVRVWNTDDYTTVLSENPDAAVLHVMEAPATGAEVWKVQLYVHTGAVLAPGKTYQVHANLAATRAQGYELCFNNEETEKGYDVLYGQQVPGGCPVSVDKKITVPADMTDAGELILQFSLGGPVRNDFLVSGVTVQELDFGENATDPGAPHTVVDLLRGQGARTNTLDVTREKIVGHLAQGSYSALRVMGAGLRSADRYTVAFTARADKPLTGEFAMMPQNGADAVIYGQLTLSPEATAYAFTTPAPLTESGEYELRWLFAPEAAAEVEISQVSVYVPAEELWVMPSQQAMTVNGVAVTPAAYAISGYNYVKLRDMAVLLKGTQAQFVVRYNAQTDTVSITTGKAYTPIGGELAVGSDYSATCARSVQSVTVNGREVKLKAYAIGGNNYFRIRDLARVIGFTVDYDAATDTVVITSPLTPEKMEAAHAYQFFFRPEIDGESQPYVGDTMPFYEDGTFYIYYLKEGGDSYNHSVYLATTPDFVHYTEYDDPVLSASRADVQDSWIGTGSVVKAEGAYYFFYTGFNSSGSQEYHEKIMVAKGSTPTAFEKVAGWEIVPPAELNQKNDFRDPQAYYDPETGTISLTVTASQNGVAKILKYTVSPDLRSVSYDGPIFADPTGLFWNLECSDTFRIGDKWYLTYSAQEDTLWYATADSRFGPYSAPQRLEGKLFYAGKHVESETGSYLVGWIRRSGSASSTTEVNGWGGNMGVQRLLQKPDGSLTLAPVESVIAAFGTSKALAATEVSPAAGSFTPAFTCADSFLLKGKFTYTGTGSFGLAFDFNGTEEQYKLISLNPTENKLSLAFQKGVVPIAETKVELVPGQTYSFTYVQDGSIGTFYLDGQTALTVRLYGTTGKNICLFAENGGVTFTDLAQFTR